MREAEDELREIKREIVESRGLVIKTNNLANALAADLKTVARRQQDAERRSFWNSVAANVLVLVVILGSVKVAWDAQKESTRAEEKGLRERLDKLTAEVAAEKEREALHIKAEGAATAFYELVRTERRQEMVDGWETLQKQPLSRTEQAFLGDAVDRARQELSVQAYQVGMEHLRMGRWQEADARLAEALRLKPNAAHAPGAKLGLARALRKLGKPREAIPKLTELAEASADKEIMDDAAFLLASCLVDVESWNEAKASLRSFLRRFPDSPFAGDARALLADIAQKR